MTTIFHTAKYQGEPQEIINKVPFIATGEKQWLGEGYYFWESYIDNAHWWGDVHYNNSYIICKSLYESTKSNSINLIDNKEHLDIIENFQRILIKEKIATSQSTLGRIIMFARRKNLLPDNYKAIRAEIPNSRKYTNKKYSKTITISDKFLLDLRPQIQVCFFDDSLFVKPLTIIYPEHYIDGYAV